MDISWPGHACLRVRTQQALVVMDPCDRSSGFDMGRPSADIVTTSSDDPNHSNVRGVRGQPLHLHGPGEYEIKAVQLTGIRTYLRPPPEEGTPEWNIAFLLEAEEIQLTHLGGLGAPLTSEQAEPFAATDILVLPIGGGSTLDAEQAARTVRDLDPKIVIPVHYPVGASGDGDGADDDGPLKAFVASVGIEPEAPVRRFSIQHRNLGETLRVVLLEPRG